MKANEKIETQKDRTRNKSKKYYQDHKIEQCKRLLNVYSFNTIKRIKTAHEAEVAYLVAKYPFYDCCIQYFKKLCYRYRIRPQSILHSDCEEACLLAYLYGICQCSVKAGYEEYILPYIFKVMRIYFCAALILGDESANICRYNGLKPILTENYRV